MKKATTRNPWTWIPTLYFAQGIPFIFINMVTMVLFTQLGMSETDAALYTGWLYLPWVIKPFWGPIVDIFKTKRWWTVTMQLCVAIGLGAIAFTLPIIDDATNADLPNVACLMFAQEQCSYLVGVVAGTMTKTGTVGYVQGMVSDSMNLFGVGFVSGVLAANPDATVLQYNANSFADSAAGAAAATNMITNGADIIYQAAGGTGIGVINACADNGKYAIGVDYDQSSIAPETVITSAMKRVDIGVQKICKALKEGSFTAGLVQYSLTDGGVDIAPTTTLLTEEALKAVEQAKADILAGKIVVPTSVDDCEAFTLDDIK